MIFRVLSLDLYVYFQSLQSDHYPVLPLATQHTYPHPPLSSHYG